MNATRRNPENTTLKCQTSNVEFNSIDRIIPYLDIPVTVLQATVVEC